MTIARVTEITASSKKSFEDAARNGVSRASKTLKNVSGAWIKDQELGIKDGEVSEYRVKLKITFVLVDEILNCIDSFKAHKITESRIFR